MSRIVLKSARRFLSYLPTVAVLVALGVLAYLGHMNHWRWPVDEKPKQDLKAAPEKDADDESDALPPIEAGDKYGFSVFDPSLPITHDPATCKLDKRDIPFANAELVRKSGIYTGRVRERKLDEILRVTGTVEFDPRLIARVAPRAGGFLWEIYKNAGDPIGKGDVLALIDSADVGKAKAAFYQAKVQLDLKQLLRDRLQAGVTPDKTIIEADAALREARVQLATSYQALLNLGLSFKLADVEKASDKELARQLQFLGLPREAADMMPDESTSNLLPVVNPLPERGIVLQRDAAKGETVAALQTIFVVGDTRRMMLQLDVRQEDRPFVTPGLKVEFTPDGAGSPVQGVIDSIGQEIDPKTRTIKVRAFVDNLNGNLQAKMYGSALIMKPGKEVLVVPEEAIQWEGCSHIVFVREKPEQFEVRKVKLGTRNEGFVEVLEGVRKREKIAVVGSHVLKAMLFKDRLGTAEE